MDIKATPNSHRYKAEQAKASEKKVQKIVSGNVKTRKKSEMSKFKDTIFAEDVNSVKSYLFIDVIIPAIKKAIFETVTNGVDMMLYGEVRGKKRSSYDQVDGGGEVDGHPYYKSVNNLQMLAYVVKSMQELNQRVSELEKENEKLKRKLKRKLNLN